MNAPMDVGPKAVTSSRDGLRLDAITSTSSDEDVEVPVTLRKQHAVVEFEDERGNVSPTGTTGDGKR